jgi:peroxiredoxin
VTTLKEQLEQHKETSRQHLAPEKRQILEDHVRTVQSAGVLNSVASVGSKAPLFTLPDHQGDSWKLDTALKTGPVVLKFYRGTWCPYCNLELHAYQSRLPRIRELGATFVAVSPEKPDFAKAFLAKEQIEFPILHDDGNVIARQFGLEFVVEESLQRLMKEFSNDLAEKNGDNSWALPIPGTFVISKGGRIEYSFANPDFTVRADPEEVLVLLGKL